MKKTSNFKRLASRRIFLFIIGFLLFCFNSTAHAEVVYEFQRVWGSWGTGNGQFGGEIRSVEVDISPGNIYVADSVNNRIEIFDPNGNLLNTFGSTGSGYWQFNGLDGIALDGSYNIYAADSGNCRIQKFGPGGKQHLAEWVSHENCVGPAWYYGPIDIAVDWRAKVYVLNGYPLFTISKFEDNGTFIMEYSSNCYGARIAIDRDGDVYVACQDGTINRFNSEGVFQGSFGGSGTGDGQFSAIWDIAVDRQKYIYATDHGIVGPSYSRIQKFDGDANFVTAWYPLGEAYYPKYLPILSGIAVDVSGNVYVADSFNRRIEKYSPKELSELDHIVLSPSSATIALYGGSQGRQTYTAMAYDASDGSMINVTSHATFSISPDGSCRGAVCWADYTGPHTVTGSFRDKTAEATLQVNLYPVQITLDLLSAEYLDCGNVSIDGSVETSDGTITNLSWDWGDGVVDDGSFPASHHYAANGTYTVTVTAYCSTGDMQSTSTTVNVTNAVYPLCEDTSPPAGTVSINSDAAATTSFSVTLNLSCNDGTGSGCAEMQFSNDNVNFSPPEPYAPTKSWILACGNGAKTVYAKFKDNAGNWSAAYSDMIDYNGDTSMRINSGDSNTSSQDVLLTTNSVSCSSYTCLGRSVKNEVDSFFTGFTCSSPAEWVLSEGVGDKTVYMTESYVCYETNTVCGRWCCGGRGPFGQCYSWCTNSCYVTHNRDMCDTIQFNTPPVAQAGGPYTTDLGNGISFDGSNSSDPDAGDSIVSYSWNIAGGTYALTGATPSLTAAQVTALGAGTHTVQLTVTDSFGATNTSSTTLTVSDNSPYASFTAMPNPAACGQAITFDASASYHGNPDRSIVGYAWSFGDAATGSGVIVSHTYSAFGAYNVTLTVTDNNVPPKTATSTVMVNVNLGNQPPVASAGGPYTANMGSGVTFNGTGSFDPNGACGDSIVSYSWNIAAGTYTLTGATPSLTAAQISSLGVGNYPVVLTVIDSFGATDNSSTTLDISSSGSPDLSGQWITLSSGKRGNQISGKLSITNSGNVAAGGFSVSYYLSEDGLTPSTLLHTDTMRGLDIGRSKSLSFAYKAQSSLSGQYIIAVIDSDNKVTETNENNNTAAKIIP